jgi:hypothetical protein
VASSKTSLWEDDLVTALAVTANTTLVAAFAGSVRDVTAYPVAFVISRGDEEEIEYDVNRYLTCNERAHVLVQGKSADQVRYAIEKIMTALMPYSSASALYAHNVIDFKPITRILPDTTNPPANDVYEGEIVFALKVRYTY